MYVTQWTNYNLEKLHVTVAKGGKTYVPKTRLRLHLPLIGLMGLKIVKNSEN